MLVMPAGLEPAISSLRGWRPNQLDDGTRWRYGPDSNRRNNSFAGCPLKPLEYRIMAGIVGLEPTMSASKAGALAAWQYPSIMEIRAGLEPVIAAVKGLCPNHLDERTIWQGVDSLRIMLRNALPQEYRQFVRPVVLPVRSDYLQWEVQSRFATCKLPAEN